MTREHMAPSRTTGAVAAAVAGAGYVVEGLLVLRHPQGDSHWTTSGYVVEATFVVALVATVVALPAVGGWLALGRAGGIGVRIAQVAYAAIGVASFASLLAGGSTLGPVFILGLLGSLVGLAVVAVTGVARGSHRWAAALPLAAMVVGIGLGDSGGSVLLGAVWLLLAQQLSSAGRSPRVAREVGAPA